MLIRIPGMRLVNGSNERGASIAKAGGVRDVRTTACAEVRKALGLGQSMAVDRAAPFLPAIITVTRIAPNKLDAHDGLPAACKPAVDGIADALIGKLVSVKRKRGTRLEMRSDDSDPRITWRYDQYRGKPREYACEINVEPRVEGVIASAFGDTFHVFADDVSACMDTVWNVAPDGTTRFVARFDAPQIRALLVQLEVALAACVAAERGQGGTGRRDGK